MNKMPDITLAQILAFFAWVVAQAVAFGWLDTIKSQLVLSAGATIIAAVWKLADGIIRASRVQAKAAVIVAGKDPRQLSA